MTRYWVYVIVLPAAPVVGRRGAEFVETTCGMMKIGYLKGTTAVVRAAGYRTTSPQCIMMPMLWLGSKDEAIAVERIIISEFRARGIILGPELFGFHPHILQDALKKADELPGVGRPSGESLAYIIAAQSPHRLPALHLGAMGTREWARFERLAGCGDAPQTGFNFGPSPPK